MLASVSLGLQVCGKVRWVENLVVVEPLPEGGFWIEALSEGSAEADDPEGQRRVRGYLEQVDAGHDPWLEGLRRAGARGVYLEADGLDSGWEPLGPVRFRLHRGGEVARAEELGAAFPDPVFEFRYLEDRDARVGALEIFPVQDPRGVREDRRRVDRAMNRLADVLRPRLAALDAIYRSLGSNRRGRLALLTAADAWAPEEGEDPPTPTARDLEMAEALQEAEALLDAVDLDDPAEPLASLFVLDASPVGGRLGVRLPPASVRGHEGFEEAEEPGLYLLREPRDVLDAVEALDGVFSPPWEDVDDMTREEIEAAEFVSDFAGTRESVVRFLWAEMLPAPLYRIEWTIPLPPSRP